MPARASRARSAIALMRAARSASSSSCTSVGVDAGGEVAAGDRPRRGLHRGERPGHAAGRGRRPRARRRRASDGRAGAPPGPAAAEAAARSTSSVSTTTGVVPPTGVERAAPRTRCRRRAVLRLAGEQRRGVEVVDGHAVREVERARRRRRDRRAESLLDLAVGVDGDDRAVGDRSVVPDEAADAAELSSSWRRSRPRAAPG